MMKIPICPYCKVPTKRETGICEVTLLYCPPIYDEHGININTDRITTTIHWHCLKCGKEWVEKEKQTEVKKMVVKKKVVKKVVRKKKTVKKVVKKKRR